MAGIGTLAGRSYEQKEQVDMSAQQMHDNPNFMDQLNEWQRVRAEKGEDPTDWGAFRDHLMAIGAPDPGFVPVNEFTAYSGGDSTPSRVIDP